MQSGWKTLVSMSSLLGGVRRYWAYLWIKSVDRDAIFKVAQ